MVFNKKSPEQVESERIEKERRAAEKAEQKAADSAQKAEARFRATPMGQARGAFEQGDMLFQCEFNVKKTDAEVVPMVGTYNVSNSNDPSDVLNSICREGWELLTASFVFHETGSESRDKFLASGQQIAVRGEVIGYYVFKRNESLRQVQPVGSAMGDQPVDGLRVHLPPSPDQGRPEIYPE